MLPRDRLRQLVRPSVLLGLGLLAALATAVVAAPWLAPHDPQQIRPSLRFLPPAWVEGGDPQYLLGTDQLGRDMLSRLIYGARTSLLIAGTAVLLSASVGTAAGLLAGYYRGVADAMLMRLAEVQLAFPFILLALAILAVSETRTAARIIVVLAVADWVVHARLIRARALAEREREYVGAARLIGCSHLRIMCCHLLPVILPTVIVVAMLQLAVLMLVESILASIGLGIDPPGISWGTILADGRHNIAVAWWMLTFPGAAIFVSVLGVNLLADGLADALDPRLKLTGHRQRQRPRGRPRSHHSISSPTGERAEPEPHDRSGAPPGGSVEPLLTVRGLRVEFGELPRILSPVVDVSFDVAAGERLGIVGESGSGKTLTALSIIGLVPQDGWLAAGSVRFAGQELVGQPPRALNRLRGGKIAMIFQDPSASLNPSLKVGYQIAEVVALHQRVNGKEARRRAVDALSLLNLSDPPRVADAYPFQLSGGMRQRVMIAMMLSCHPKLLIADEPTTSVDVTTQMQILKELDALIRRLGTSIILITHDLGVVANFTDRTAVIYGGVTCEIAPTNQLLGFPQHPYTRALLEAMIDLDRLGRRPQAIPGDSPDPGRRSQGCPFVLRCPAALDRCREERPGLRQVADNHLAACHLFPSDKPG